MGREDRRAIAVIGSGAAGAECVIALRERGYSGEIHLFTDSRWPIYNPMLTTYYVAGKIGFDQLFPYGSNGTFYTRYRVDIHPGSPVVALDAVEKVITTQAGLEFKYGQCLIASGASPLLPRIEGIDSERVYTMRTVEDAVRLKEALAKRPRKALVVGASMVGIKLVELLHLAGIEVCLADLAEQVFPLAAHPECARIIEGRLRDRGIRLRFGAGIQRVEETPGGVGAYFTDSAECEESDLIVICIGVRANVGFIDRTQVEVGQGILVDERMQTSVSGLYAAGDVAQGKELLSGGQQIIGLWANARYQGRTAGRNMAGANETLPGNVPHNITHFMGMDFVGIGSMRGYDRVDQESDGERFIQLFWKDGLLIGANLLDSYVEAGVIKSALVKGLLQGRVASLRSLPIDQGQINYDVSPPRGYAQTEGCGYVLRPGGKLPALPGKLFDISLAQ